jgi:hypothetical protein
LSSLQTIPQRSRRHTESFGRLGYGNGRRRVHAGRSGETSPRQRYCAGGRGSRRGTVCSGARKGFLRRFPRPGRFTTATGWEIDSWRAGGSGRPSRKRRAGHLPGQAPQGMGRGSSRSLGGFPVPPRRGMDRASISLRENQRKEILSRKAGEARGTWEAREANLVGAAAGA